MNNKYPRILLVTYLDMFKDNESETYTVRSFIDNWPKENVYQLICEDFNSSEGGRMSSNNYRLVHRDIRIASWLIPGRRKVKTSLRPQLTKQTEKKTQSLKTSIRKFIVDLYSFLPYRLNKQFISFLNDIKPDVLYCCNASLRMFVLCDKISHLLNIPFIPHIMDDWPNSEYTGTMLSRPLKVFFKKKFNAIIQRSPFVFCICELMCREYEKRYSYHNFLPLMNSVEDYSSLSTTVINNRAIYGGSLYLDRYKSLLAIAKALHELNRTDVEIVVYTKQSQWEELKHYFSDFPFVCYGGFITQTELMKQIVSSKYLLFLESIDEEMLDYTRLSMSTKIPEYLSSKRPIFAIGNIKQGSIDYLNKYSAAYIVSDLKNVKAVMSKMLFSDNQQRVINNAYSLYMKNHIKEKQQDKFLDCILSVIHS